MIKTISLLNKNYNIVLEDNKIKENEDFKLLYNDSKKIIYNFIRKYYTFKNSIMDINELYQECSILFLNTIKDYEPQKGTFVTLLNLKIRNFIFNFYRDKLKLNLIRKKLIENQNEVSNTKSVKSIAQSNRWRISAMNAYFLLNTLTITDLSYEEDNYDITNNINLSYTLDIDKLFYDELED